MFFLLRKRSPPKSTLFPYTTLFRSLIIGILAAIAIPSFLSQKSKASESYTKELARTAETTAETFATDTGGIYTRMNAAELQKYEPTIQIAVGNGNAYLSEVKVPAAGEYVVTAKATDGHTFSIEKKANGEVLRTCLPAGKTGSEGGGCQNSVW